jgi:AcrR family transcriptional regulator
VTAPTTAPTASPRPYLRADARRTQLLDAAARLFVRKGYGGMTMVALAEEAGVSRRLVYDHFADLAALYEAFFADRARRYLASTEAALAEADGDPLRACTGAFARLLAMAPDDQRAIRLLVADPGIPDLAVLRARFRDHVEERWLPFVDATMDPEVARALLWTIVGVFLSLADLVNRAEITPEVATRLATALVVSVPDALA